MSTPNWPIRVGGEYRVAKFPKTQYAQVAAIDGDRVYFSFKCFGGRIHCFPGIQDIHADNFRFICAPEDQSPIPELVAALKAVKKLFAEPSPFYISKLGAPITNGDQAEIDGVFAASEAALAKAGER